MYNNHREEILNPPRVALATTPSPNLRSAGLGYYTTIYPATVLIN